MNERCKTKSDLILILCLTAAFVLTAAVMLTAAAGNVHAAAQPKILETLYAPDENSVELWTEGDFMTGQAKTLKMINKYRKEACEKGYPDPRNKKRKLTKSDYVPIKWSCELEKFTRIRAAEASLYMSHDRPGGRVYKDENIRYETGSAENLAWGAYSPEGAARLWYGEKDTWIKKKKGVTGHYTHMINPDIMYVGISGFNVHKNLGNSCACGRFSREEEDMDQTILPKTKNVIVPISVYKDGVSEKPVLKDLEYDGFDKKKITLYQSSVTAFAVVRSVEIEGDEFFMLEPELFTYRSSNRKALPIDINGNGYVKFKGNVKVTATGTSGKTYNAYIKAKNILFPPKITSCTKQGGKMKVAFKTTKVNAVYANGFEIQAAADRSFKKKIKKARTKVKRNSWRMPKTKYTKMVKRPSGKTCYVRTRIYFRIQGRNYYSTWSKIKKVR